MLLLPLSAYLEPLRTVAVFPKRGLSLFLSINTKGWAWGRCGWKSQPCLVAHNVGVLIALGFRKIILNSKCVSPSSKMEVWLTMLIFLPLFHVFLGIFPNTPKWGKSALLRHSQLTELWMCDGAFQKHHTVHWGVRQSHCLNHQKCSSQRSHFCRFIKPKKWLCLVCVDGCRAHGAFWLNLMHKLGICRNLLMVLLRAFLIAPHQVQKRDKKRKTLWFCTPLDYFFLSCTGSTRSGKGLCCMDTTESSKGGVQVGLCLCSCRNPWDSLCCLQILRGAHLEASPAFPRFALLLLVPRLRVSSMSIYPLSKGLLSHELCCPPAFTCIFMSI